MRTIRRIKDLRPRGLYYHERTKAFRLILLIDDHIVYYIEIWPEAMGWSSRHIQGKCSDQSFRKWADRDATDQEWAECWLAEEARQEIAAKMAMKQQY